MGSAPVKVVVTHVYSSANKGDHAILLVLLAELTRVFPDAAITILTMEDVAPGQLIQGWPAHTSLHGQVRAHSNPFGQVVAAASMLGRTTAYAIRRRLQRRRPALPPPYAAALGALADADLVVPVGGGYFRGREGARSTLDLALLVHPLMLAAIMRRPVVLHTQSLGPFASNAQRRLVRTALRFVDRIILREDVSYSYLLGLGVPPHKLVRSVDAGFLFSDHETDEPATRRDRPRVGITVRAWLIGDAQRTYERAISTLVDHITSVHDMDVVFIPQVTSNRDDDRLTARAVAAGAARSDRITVLEDSFSASEISELYADLDYLVGTRFHSVIFALTAGVPCLAVEYEHKTSGILADLELEEWVVAIEDVTGDGMVAMFDHLVAWAPSYKEHLREVVPAYRARASEAAEIVRDTYLKRVS